MALGLVPCPPGLQLQLCACCPVTGSKGSWDLPPTGHQVDTYGFRLKRSLNPDMLLSLFLYFSAISFSFVQVICTLSGVGGA